MDDSGEGGPTRRRRGGASVLAAIDRHVGARVRRRRVELGLSQQALAASLGLSYQQVQKYERGSNRISSGVLWRLGALLAVPFSHFYEGLVRGAFHPTPIAKGAYGADDADAATVSEREILELIKAYGAIADPSVRKSVRMLLGAVARPGAGGSSDPARRLEPQRHKGTKPPE